MRIIRIVGIVSVLVFAVVLAWTQQKHETKAPPPLVSLIRVIANPEKFAGQRIRVIGVLNYGGGLDRAVCVYVSEQDARNSVMSNCIYVNGSFDSRDKLLGKYVIFNATFRYTPAPVGCDSLGTSFDDVSDMRLLHGVQE